MRRPKFRVKSVHELSAVVYDLSTVRLIGYMRVSRSDGSQTIDLQRDALIAAGVDPAQIYEDRASGRLDARPGLGATLKALRAALVVWRLDRLGRNLRHLVNTVHDLTKRGVGFKVLTGHGASIDTTTPAGSFHTRCWKSGGNCASIRQPDHCPIGRDPVTGVSRYHAIIPREPCPLPLWRLGNLSTVLAGILIFCCVLGLKPVRAFLFFFTSLPKPGRTNSPFFLTSLYANVLSVSRNAPAVFLFV